MIANRFSTLLPGRIAVGLAAGVVTLTGAATAAYACVLPSPIQSFAHTTIGAPRPTDPKLSVAQIDAAKWKNYPTPSVSVTPTATPSASVSAASVTASVTPTPTPTKSPAPKLTKKPTLDPAQLAAVEAIVDYRLCQSYTTFTKAGQDPRPEGARTPGEGGWRNFGDHHRRLLRRAPGAAEPVLGAARSDSKPNAERDGQGQQVEGRRLVALVRHLPDVNGFA